MYAYSELTRVGFEFIDGHQRAWCTYEANAPALTSSSVRLDRVRSLRKYEPTNSKWTSEEERTRKCQEVEQEVEELEGAPQDEPTGAEDVADVDE